MATAKTTLPETLAREEKLKGMNSPSNLSVVVFPFVVYSKRLLVPSLALVVTGNACK